ncbi:MAG: type I polyketide synthase [Solirubrobacteraceae bacterium]
MAMDPQQRLLLECSWEALEHAGIDPLSLRGSDTGVFAGAFHSGYGSGEVPPELEGFRLTGGITSAISGRVSYVLGLQGPAISVDTACSSSLVATHLACQALRAGECDLALGGGVTVVVTPEDFVELSRQRALSPDGRCRAFGAGANGAGFSDGVGVLVLERLSVAEQRGHRVLALVRGSAVNQDGASNGLTAPSGPSQERVITAALANAGLAPADIDAVEAHGTGTTLGDPIEAQALIAAYGQHRDGAPPLRLGSLKSNIGHAQAAAGVGGLIKMVAALQHETLPATLWAQQPSPHVRWQGSQLELLTEPVPWPTGARTRRAAISAFGVSGTNAHVLIEEAPPRPATTAPRVSASVLPFMISGSSEAALRAQAQRLADHLAHHPDLDPAAVAATLAHGRAHLTHRAVAVADGLHELTDCLRAHARGDHHDALIGATAGHDRRTAFIFPGQGGQWPGMAVELLAQSPAFAAAMRDCGDVLAALAGFSLDAVLRGDPDQPSIDLIEVVQPVLFAIMASLAALWRSYGVHPSAVLGHSQGEIAAAHVAGSLSLDDAARIVVVRSRALARIAGQGGMISVGLSPEQLAPRTADFGERLAIAAVNSPTSLVVSGDLDALERLLRSCEADGIPARAVASTVAGHCAQIEPLRDEMRRELATVTPRPAEVPLYSTVTGGLLDTATMGAEHWFRNLRQTVLFEPAVRAMMGDGVNALIEVSPHPILTTGVLQTIETTGHDPDTIAVIGSLRRQDGGPERFTRSLAEAHATGIKIDWRALLDTDTIKHAPLPTYAFQHRRYWLTGDHSRNDPTSLGQAPAQHPLLDAAITLADGQGTIFTGRLSLDRHPWLADHTVRGTTLLPATALLELALHAATHIGTPHIQHLTITQPLPLHPEHAVALQLNVTEPDHDGHRRLTIHSRPDDPDTTTNWTTHATATLTPTPDATDTLPTPPPPDDTTEIQTDELYDRLERTGLEYGPAFQSVRRVWQHDGEILAEVQLADAELDRADGFLLHPSMLDAALQSAALLAPERRSDALLLVDSWSDVRLLGAAPPSLKVRVRLGDHGDAAHATVTDDEDHPVASLRATLSAAAGRRAAHAPSAGFRDSLLRVAWHELAASDSNDARYALLGAPLGGRHDPLADLIVHPDLASVAASIDPAQPAPAAVFADFRTAPAAQATAQAARIALGRALELIQSWLSAEDLSASRLVFVTSGAIAAAEGDGVPALASAPLWGLVRSAQSEHPDRFALIDVDEGNCSPSTLTAAVASGEPQLAVRQSRILVPRLARLDDNGSPPDLGEQSAGTVLITGGTGGVGALIARHLVARHGVSRLLLVSRRGRLAPGAVELEAELTATGADVRVAACDVGDRAQVERLIRSIPSAHSLTGVVHAAGDADNGLIESMTPEQIDRVLAPKADGALHLHELTLDLELDLFVLCSSMAATFGGPGQANYAAANALLDALAEHRRARGLAGTSVEWGIWDGVGRARALGDARRLLRRMSGSASFRPFAAETGLEMFEGALAAAPPVVLASPFRADVVRDEVAAATAPPLLSALVRSRPRRVAVNGNGSPRRRPSDGGAGQPRRSIVDETRAQIAGALGHESADRLQMGLSFVELGFDSLVSLELRRRLQSVTGLALPATVMFDHPTPAALIEYLQGRLGSADGAQPELRVESRGTDGAESGTLAAMFRRAHRLGRARDGVAIAEAAARLRPRFGVSHIEAQAPALIPLTHGDDGPVLFCLPSLVATGGPHEFARFARELGPGGAVVAVPAPGFGADELLPSTLDAVVGAQVAAVGAHAGGRQIALLGYSTGGLLAYAVAAGCVRAGIAPAAVVLIDSYTMDTMWSIADPVFHRMLDGDGSRPAVDDATLTAMGAYLGLLSRWSPGPPPAPTLLVKAADPVPGVDRNGDWTATWSLRHATSARPGTHLTLLEDHAESTAHAVQEWLSAHPQGELDALPRRRRRHELARRR